MKVIKPSFQIITPIDSDQMWRHFFKLRTPVAAHPQMREIAMMLLNEFKARIPVLFDDIECEVE